MRRLGVLGLSLFLIIAGGGAAAEPPPTGLEVKNRIQIKFCRHSSEIPHFSEHVPGTMNASGRTTCTGTSKNWRVSVRVTLVRDDGGNTPPVTKSISGNGRAVINISMPCNRSRKQARVLYTITTVHKVPSGEKFYTENEALLAC